MQPQQPGIASVQPAVAVVSESLKAVLRDAGTNTSLEAWCLQEGLLNAMDFALLCSKEEQVDEKITAHGMLHATHPIVVGALRDKIAIRKAWTLARSSMDRENKQAEAGTALEAPLHSRTALHLQEAWQNYHHFRLSNAMMLIATTMATIYRQLHANPRQLAIFLPQNLRTQACVLPGAKRLLTMSKTGNIEAQGEVADACDGHHDLYIRLRAFFYTIAYFLLGCRASSPSSRQSTRLNCSCSLFSTATAATWPHSASTSPLGPTPHRGSRKGSGLRGPSLT